MNTCRDQTVREQLLTQIKSRTNVQIVLLLTRRNKTGANTQSPHSVCPDWCKYNICAVINLSKQAPVSTSLYLCYENSLTLDSSLFFKRGKKKGQKPASLWLFVSSHLSVSWLSCPRYFSLPPGLSLLLRSSCSMPYTVSCLFPPLLQSLHTYHPPLCLPLPISRTHVGLIEPEDPALIKGWVRLNASKPLRLQSRAA